MNGVWVVYVKLCRELKYDLCEGHGYLKLCVKIGIAVPPSEKWTLLLVPREVFKT